MIEQFSSQTPTEAAKPQLITEVPGFPTRVEGQVSAERDGQPVDFSQQSVELLTGLDEGASIEVRVGAVAGFIDGLTRRLEQGEVRNVRTDIAYQPEEIAERLAQLEAVLNGRVKMDQDPMLLIPKSNGMRDAIVRLVADERTASVLLDVIAGRVSPEILAAQNKEKARRDLGDEALGEAGVRAPEAAADPLDALSPEDRRDVLEYRTLLRERTRAHAEGRWVDSKDRKEAAYYLFQMMSTRAKAAMRAK